MKLNLLPKSVAKHVQSKTAFAGMLVLVVLSLFAAFAIARSRADELATLKEEASAKGPLAKLVVDAAAEADRIIAEARIVLTNTALVEEIDRANRSYPDLYDELLPYLPSFFRLKSITAQSVDPQTSTVTITGYLKTFQQYTDIMISLLRFPDTTAVGRSGFGPLTSGDEGPFGYNPLTTDRGPMPGWSAVTLTMTIARPLQAPDPRPTLAAAATGTAPAAPGAAPGAGPPAGLAPGGRPGPVPAGGPPGAAGPRPPGPGAGAGAPR